MQVGDVLLSWRPIDYTWDSGYYEIGYATTPGGPYTVIGATSSKTDKWYRVGGLASGMTHYFAVRTYSQHHGEQKNDLTSPYGPEMAVALQPIQPAELPFHDGFESGALSAHWLPFTTNDGRLRVSNLYPDLGTYSLLLDDGVGDENFSTAGAVLALDLAGVEQAELSFWWRTFPHANEPEDGLFLSDDRGQSWVACWPWTTAWRATTRLRWIWTRPRRTPAWLSTTTSCSSSSSTTIADPFGRLCFR